MCLPGSWLLKTVPEEINYHYIKKEVVKINKQNECSKQQCKIKYKNSINFIITNFHFIKKCVLRTGSASNAQSPGFGP